MFKYIRWQCGVGLNRLNLVIFLMDVNTALARPEATGSQLPFTINKCLFERQQRRAGQPSVVCFR